MDEKKITIDDFKTISKRDKDKLKKFGILYPEEVLILTHTALVNYIELSPESADKILQEAVRLTEDEGILMLEDLEREERERRFLKTGSNNLDDILRGGYISKSVTELAGEFGSGKTQACLTAIGTVFLPPEEGGLNEGDISVIMMDTEGTFSLDRLTPIFRRFDIDPNEARSRIIKMKPRNSHEQLRMILQSIGIVRDRNVKLYIVDSITKFPRIDFEGREELYERQRMILQIVEILRRIAQTYNIIVLVTNQVVSIPDERFGGEKVPVGGNVLGHTVDTRLYLKKQVEDIRLVKIIDSSWLPPRKTRIRVTEAGITDP